MSQQPVALLTRKETFSACHRLHSKHLSDAENVEIYGKCNNPNGHGHNYTVYSINKLLASFRSQFMHWLPLDKRQNLQIAVCTKLATVTFEVTVRGPIDIRTGMVMNITDLKLAMDGVIFKQLDHKNLDKDVEYFQNVPSTTENLTVFIWDNVRQALKRPDLLFEVKIYETEKNSVTYRGPYAHNGQYLNNKRTAKTSCNNISSDSD